MLTFVPAFPFQAHGVFKIAQHRPIVGRLSRTLEPPKFATGHGKIMQNCKTNKILDPNWDPQFQTWQMIEYGQIV